MNTSEIELTPSQDKLLGKMEAFLDSKERFFLLTGKPGVGKTTITKMILKDHIQADKNSQGFYNMNVAGITLSHQAKNVLGEHIPHVFTFAKAFGMKEKVDERTGMKTFEYDKWAEGVVGKRSVPVFVHDEVSQYTQEMLDIVVRDTPMFSKIIMIGDKAQLPPIDPDNKMGRDADSPVFNWDFPESCKHELTERVRQAEGNPILELSDIIREEIFGNEDIGRVLNEIRSPRMEDGVGYDFIKYDELLSHIEDKDILNTRVLAYRNKTINKLNPYIRNHLLDNPEETLVDGDIITMTDNYYHFKDGDPTNRPMYMFYNSETFRLKKLHKTVATRNVKTSRYRFDVFNALIEGKDQEQFITPTDSGRIQFERILSGVADECKMRKMSWPEDFWPLKESVCQYTYGYASSIYKAQGSTYDTIYLDINDVLMTRPITPKRKLQAIYTAITRARYDVYFLKS